MRRRAFLQAIVAVALLTTAVTAWAFWTAGGSGASTAGTGSISAASISVPASSAGAITVTWTQQASLVPPSAANGNIAYRIERKLGAGAFDAVTTGPCSGDLPYGTTSCVDTVGASGTYAYRVTATFNSWNSVSAQSGNVVATVDTTAPTVASINRVATSPTSASSVSWTVTFSEAVSSVDASDFTLAASGVTGASVTSVTGSGTTRTVVASTGTGSGSLGLNLVDDDTVVDNAVTPNKLGGTGAGNGNFTGQLYTVDRTPPTVASINRLVSSPTAAASVTWRATFSESVTGAEITDFTLAGSGVTGATITSVTGTGTTRTVTASTGSGSGTLGLNLVDDDTIADTLGQPLGASGAGNGNFTGQLYTVDRTAPALTTLQFFDVNLNGKIDQVKATFNETLAASTATAPWNMTGVPSGGALASVSASGTVATLTLTEGEAAADTSPGTFMIALAASATGIRDSLGNQSSFAATAAADKAKPIPLTVTDSDGTTNGLLQTNDTMTASFSEPIASAVAATTTITITRPSSGNATLNIPSFTNGALSTGSANYLNATGSAAFTATTQLSNANKTLTITAGACSSGCALVSAGTGTTLSYVPATGLLDAAGNAAGGTRTTGFALF